MEEEKQKEIEAAEEVAGEEEEDEEVEDEEEDEEEVEQNEDERARQRFWDQVYVDYYARHGGTPGG